MFERYLLRLRFLQFIRNPTRTSLVSTMYELASRVPSASKGIAAVETRAWVDHGFRELYGRRAILDIPSLERLATAPENTLGFAYAAHILKHNLKAQFYTSPKADRLIDYVSYRLYQTHDLWHVVLGYDTSPAGEMGVQAFTLAQLGSPFTLLLMAGGMVSIVGMAPELSEEVFTTMSEGYERGKRASFLLGFPFEKHWETPLFEVRQITGVNSKAIVHDEVRPDGSVSQ